MCSSDLIVLLALAPPWFPFFPNPVSAHSPNCHLLAVRLARVYPCLFHRNRPGALTRFSTRNLLAHQTDTEMFPALRQHVFYFLVVVFQPQWEDTPLPPLPFSLLCFSFLPEAFQPVLSSVLCVQFFCHSLYTRLRQGDLALQWPLSNSLVQLGDRAVCTEGLVS